MPESRSRVFMEAWAGDFSPEATGIGALSTCMAAVRVEMDGRVVMVVWLPLWPLVLGAGRLSSHGRWATEASILTLSGQGRGCLGVRGRC